MNNNFGSYYEDLKVGQQIDHWPGKTILESDNNLFCLLTMNHHPVHLDVNYASNAQHSKILVVGTLVLSLAVGLTVKDISGKAIANLEYDRVIHHTPVYLNDTIYATTKILSKQLSQKRKDRGIVHVMTVVYNQEKIKVLSFERKILLPRKKSKL